MAEHNNYKYKKLGYTLEIDLPEKYGYKGYSVECTYRYDKSKEKYLLSMWLKCININEKFKVDSQEIDYQYISGTRDTIIENITRIVEQASKTKFFDYYIEEFEYTFKCFDKGDEFFEQERLNHNNGGVA